MVPIEKIKRWLITLCAVLGVALTARLGVWQLDRAEQKRALQAAIQNNGQLPPLELPQLAHDSAGATAQYYRLVRLQGRWLPDRTVFLDNRQMNGRVGFFVLTPLALPTGEAVLVQRGWIPRDAQERSRLPQFATPATPVEVLGRIGPPPSSLYDFSGGVPGPIRQNLELAAFARETGLSFRPLSIQQLNESNRSSDGLLRDWWLPQVDIAKHLGYAFQWFSLSVLIAGLYVWFQLLHPRFGRRSHTAA